MIDATSPCTKKFYKSVDSFLMTNVNVLDTLLSRQVRQPHPVFLYSCIPVFLYTCILVFLYSCIPVFLYSCIPSFTQQ